MIRWCRCTMLSVQYMHLSSYLISFRHYSYTYFQTLDTALILSCLGSYSGFDVEDDPTPYEGVWVICLIPVPECFSTSDGGDGSVRSSDLVISGILILQFLISLSVSLSSVLSSRRIMVDWTRRMVERRTKVKQGMRSREHVPRQNAYHRKSRRCTPGTILKGRIPDTRRVG